MLIKREFERNDFIFRLAASVTVVAGLFSLIVFALLTVNYLQIRAADPINDPLVTELRMKYAKADEQDEALAQKIRELDLLQRKAFFTSQNVLRLGGILLLVGVSVFLVAFKNMARWRPDKPELSETPAADEEFLAYATSRQYVTWGGVALLGMGMAAAIMTESLLTEVADANGGVEQPVVEPPEPKGPPTWDEMQLNWTSFRGPGSAGRAHYTNTPTEWDGESGQAIKWKSDIDLPGVNSPVAWGNRVFLSGATNEKLEVYCYDAESGDLLWTKSKAVTLSPDNMPTPSRETGFAAPSMVAHGERVFAIFATGDLVAYDFEGNKIWAKSMGIPDNHYGHSSSLIALDDLLYVQLDQHDAAKLYALDIATGKQRWAQAREDISWASPILADAPKGFQLVLLSTNTVDAYDPVTGKPLWTGEFLGSEVGPSPTYSNGVVFAADGMGAYAVAFSVDGPEDSLERTFLWEYEEVLPDMSSPVGDGARFYIATVYGELVGLDAASGEELWVEEDVSEARGGFVASPILVGDKIYVLDEDGKMFIVRAGAKYELLGTASLGEEAHATPAFMDGRIYIRGKENLYCIE
ncbi:MAG: PQQ-binding-like beta-propeller repeat protein [Candidatus Hydrogenedentes bacterium]|nr:PQQ-binding-like beta-propeller repeat protein [Candidatus Hydrogenedentota bacterium]